MKLNKEDIRKSTYEELDRVIDRLNRLTEETDLETDISRFGSRHMAIDMIDHPEMIEVVADIPGFDKEDIRIRANDKRLTITAEHKEETEVEEKDYFKRERTQKSLERTVTLPVEIRVEDATSTYENGILRITLPKVEPEQEKTEIDIR